MQLEPARCSLVAMAVCLIATAPASASFVFMQIEQVIVGVDGDTSAQAIQLRMRFPGANDVQFARVRAWDSAGANPKEGYHEISLRKGLPNGFTERRWTGSVRNDKIHIMPQKTRSFEAGMVFRAIHQGNGRDVRCRI